MLARSEARGGGCPAGGDRDKVAQSAALYAPVLGETHREPQGTIDPALHLRVPLSETTANPQSHPNVSGALSDHGA
jgi:hypothetical protein